MRPKERIPIYLSLWQSIWVETEMNTIIAPLPFEFPENLILTKKSVKKIVLQLSKTWNNHPDWRLSQLLVNLGLYPNYPGLWYYMEDYDVMKKLGFPDSEIFLWGTYGINGDEPLKYLILKDMKLDHIQAILDNCRLNPETKQILKNHLLTLQHEN